MGGTHYFVLRQGGGYKNRPCLHYHNFQQDIAHQWSTEPSWGTLGDVPKQLEAVPTIWGGPWGPKPCRTFDVLGAETATQYTLCHDYQALLRFAALGNKHLKMVQKCCISNLIN